MSLGLRRAGFNVLAAIEIDPLAVETYRLNHPSTLVVEGDIRRVNANDFARQVLPQGRRLDLLAACPPCQGFSAIRTLRRRSSSSDVRNRLIFDILRFIEALRPRAILFENVPGLARDWRFARLRAALRHAGYYVQHRVEDACEYGVPQRRRRLVLVATETSTSWHAPKHVRKRTVRDAIAGLPPVGTSGDLLHDYRESRGASVRARIQRLPKDGGSRHNVPSLTQLPCHVRTNGFYDVYGRMAWDDVAPTITSGCINPSKGRFVHPDQDRAITLREAALLQSFPREYRFSMKKGRYAVAVLIGNAFPPAVVESQAKVLRKLLHR